MVTPKVLEKSRRLLVLGSAFFVLGLAFFILDGTVKPAAPAQIVIPTPTPPQMTAVPIPNISALKSYPPPETFQHFSYDPAHVTKANFLHFEGECKNKLVAFLVFPVSADYRIDPTKAVFNRAVDCPDAGKFVYDIQLSELASLQYGKYYTFSADQPTNGLWYNPK